jgi:hypothetical protein
MCAHLLRRWRHFTPNGAVEEVYLVERMVGTCGNCGLSLTRLSGDADAVVGQSKGAAFSELHRLRDMLVCDSLTYAF